MQAALKFFDFPFKGTSGESVQKIGIKLPNRSGEYATGDENGFMAIMSALTQIPPQELQTTLDQLDWVPVEGNSGELVPLIDLTAHGDGNTGFANTLFPKQGIDLPAVSEQPVQSGLRSPTKPNIQDQNFAKLAFGLEDQPPSSSSDAPDKATASLPQDAPNKTATSDLKLEIGKGQASVTMPVTDTKQAKANPVFQAISAEQPGNLSDKPLSADRFEPPLSAKNQQTEFKAPAPDPTTTRDTADSKPSDAQPLRLKLFDALPSRETLTMEDQRPNGTAGHTNKGNRGNNSAKLNQWAPADHIVADDRRSTPNQVPQPTRFSGTARHQASFGIASPDTDAGSREVILPNAEQMKDANLKELVRMDSKTVRSEQAMTQSSSDGGDGQAQNNSGREGSPSYEARLAAPNQKGVAQVAGVKEAMPFVDKETHTDVIRQIVQRMTIRTEKQQSQMVIRLKPDFLGNVRLHVTTENQQVMVRMEAESALVKDIVEQNMPHLKAELHQHGLEIEKFDVFVGNDNDGSRNGQQQTNFRQALKRNGEKQSYGDDNQSEEDEDSNEAKASDARRTIPRGASENEVDYFV